MSFPPNSFSLDDSPDAVIATAADGKIIFWNRGAETLFGYSSSEAHGQTVSELIQAPELPTPDSAANVPADGSTYTFETMRKRKDGSLVDVCISVKAFRNQNNEVEYHLATAKDMTALKVRRDSKMLEAQFGHLVEAMPDGIVMINPAGRIVLTNGQAERIFGYGPGELLGRLVEELIPPRFRGGHVGHRSRYVGQPRTRPMGAGLELYGLRKDGTEFPVEISLSPIKTTDGTLVSSAIRDITDRKTVQRELEEKNAALESANQELEAFTYSISHDLRAPLRAMGGFARILEKQLSDSASPEAKQAMSRIRENASRMGKLIDGLLDFSSLGRRALRMKLVSPGELALIVFEELRGEITGRAVELNVDPMPECFADVTLLKQVLANLLSNAAKYTRDRNPAIITVGAFEQNAETVYFVRDNGAGFDMEYSSKLFRVFQRLHREDQFEGTGVGLAIVHRIIDRHGGRIWAEGRVDEGATFYFTLGKNEDP